MNDFIKVNSTLFEYYKQLAEKAMNQIPDEKLFEQYNKDSNSIAIIVNHLWGNMLSRWTNFLTTDGEKEWRDRDAEFETIITTKEELYNKWNEGWACLFDALNQLSDNDLSTIIYIRNQGQTVMEAVSRQLAHYSSHVGQIIYIAKMYCATNWQTLSITKGNSQAYNNEKFAQEKAIKDFTSEFTKPKND